MAKDVYATQIASKAPENHTTPCNPQAYCLLDLLGGKNSEVREAGMFDYNVSCTTRGFFKDQASRIRGGWGIEQGHMVVRATGAWERQGKVQTKV